MATGAAGSDGRRVTLSSQPRANGNLHALAQGISCHRGSQWFAGLFYLPRLYVYHADANDSISIERFRIMERRLFAIMTIARLASVGLGAAMVAAAPILPHHGVLRIKMLLVLMLIAYHSSCYKLNV